jgi:hypothetical protein
VKRDRKSPNVMSPLSPRIRSNSSSDPRIRKNSSGSRVRNDKVIYRHVCFLGGLLGSSGVLLLDPILSEWVKLELKIQT